MAYTIYKSDGTPITVPDNAIDTQFYNTAANIGFQLTGRNAINYGAATAQNFLQITENFCGTVRPPDALALQGQLWFDKASEILYVKTTSATGASSWKNIIVGDNAGNITISGTMTANAFVGSLTGNAATATTATTATTLAVGRTIAVSGDATGTSPAFNGSAAVAIPLTLANSGATAGTYGSSTEVPVVTVDAKGRVTSISQIAVSGGGGGSGTVTSVAATASGGLSVIGSPITTSGTLAFSLSEFLDSISGLSGDGAIVKTSAVASVVSLSVSATSDSIMLRNAAGNTEMNEASLIGGFPIGYRNIPILGYSATIAADSVGKIYTATGPVTIPATGFVAGDVVSIFNDDAGPINIIPEVGMTMWGPAAATGTRVLESKGICTIWFRTATSCKISGDVT